MAEKTCQWCGAPLQKGQNMFCCTECHDLYVETYGNPGLSKEMHHYDYSDYDPEDEKYGDFDIEDEDMISDPDDDA